MAFYLSSVARVRTGFREKFGVPRQSGLVPEARGRVVFEPPYRSKDALRGIEGFSHLWLIWGFDRNKGEKEVFHATVRPPRLGGNAHVGVFATRSPFRPNGLGLSLVTLERVDWDAPDGPALIVGGVDMADGTPVFDVKPYIPAVESVPDARAGFAAEDAAKLGVDFPPELLARVGEADGTAITGILAQDPRPRYQDDPARIYGVTYAGWNVRFTVTGGVARVVEVEKV